MSKKARAAKKGVSQFDMLCSLITAIFFVDTIASVATMGFASITWNLIVALIFFLPGSLTVAELGATYPDNGGFYSWIKRAFGELWGARISWIYWICNSIWISSVCTLIVNVFCQVFYLELPKIVTTVANIGIIWLIMFVASRPNESSQKITNISCIAKFILGGCLVAAAIAFLARGEQMANVISAGAFRPTFGAAIVFIPALIYNFLGFEVGCSNAAELENPARDVPKAALKNCILVTVLYLVTVLSMLVVLPAGDISIIRGLVDAYRTGFGTGMASTIISYALGLIFVGVLFCQGMMWILSVCRVARESALSGELPAQLSKQNRHGSPSGSLLVSGCVASAMTIASSFLTGGAEVVFWSIFSCTSFLLLIPYIVNFEAYLKLKRTDTETPRAYTFPGPPWLATLFVRIGELVCLATMFLFIWVPGTPFDIQTAGFVLMGIVVALGSGELIVRRCMARRTSLPPVPGTERTVRAKHVDGHRIEEIVSEIEERVEEKIASKDPAL